MSEPIAEALRLQRHAAELGFDWGPRHGAAERGCGSGPGALPDAAVPSYLDELWDKLAEEIGELREAVTLGPEATTDELGDLLFMAVNLARHLGIDPAQALRATNQKFTRRFSHILKNIEKLPAMGDPDRLDRMEALWQEAKRAERP